MQLIAENFMVHDGFMVFFFIEVEEYPGTWQNDAKIIYLLFFCNFVLSLLSGHTVSFVLCDFHAAMYL